MHIVNKSTFDTRYTTHKALDVKSVFIGSQGYKRFVLL